MNIKITKEKLFMVYLIKCPCSKNTLAQVLAKFEYGWLNTGQGSEIIYLKLPFCNTSRNINILPTVSNF